MTARADAMTDGPFSAHALDVCRRYFRRASGYCHGCPITTECGNLYRESGPTPPAAFEAFNRAAGKVSAK